LSKNCEKVGKKLLKSCYNCQKVGRKIVQILKRVGEEEEGGEEGDL
jgi:hypothetical protein